MFVKAFGYYTRLIERQPSACSIRQIGNLY